MWEAIYLPLFRNTNIQSQLLSYRILHSFLNLCSVLYMRGNRYILHSTTKVAYIYIYMLSYNIINKKGGVVPAILNRLRNRLIWESKIVQKIVRKLYENCIIYISVIKMSIRRKRCIVKITFDIHFQ